MAFQYHSKDVIGQFREKTTNNIFEFSENNDTETRFYENFSHKIWVGACVNDQGFRYANVLKTVAYVAVDEDECGRPVLEKWNIKNHRLYQTVK